MVADSAWEQARLIPVSGINGADEQERRGVSALLAVLESVREFGRVITGALGAPAGTISTFIEVPFQLGERTVRPDGLIRVSRGKQTWTALVEAKTGRNDLDPAQLDAYLNVARENQFDLVLTISNQIVAAPDEHPTAVDRKKLKKVALKHLSWSQIHTEAVIQRVNRSVADPDQAWILAELIRYLEHPRSGAVDFDDMGTSWVKVRDQVKTRTLRAGDKAAADVVGRYGQLMAFAGMRLSRSLGVIVQPVLSRAERKDLGVHVQAGISRLVDTGMLTGALQVPNTAAPMNVVADLRSGLVSCSMTVQAPTQGRNKTRVNWFLRQLAKAPAGTMIEAWSAWARVPGPCHALTTVRENPEILVEDQKNELKSFTVRISAPAGTKRGQGRGTFVGSVLDLVNTFYEDVMQHVRPWTPPAPTPKAFQSDDDHGPDEDGITGELPIKQERHPTPTPTWEPAPAVQIAYSINDGSEAFEFSAENSRPRHVTEVQRNSDDVPTGQAPPLPDE